ncbi:MAG TPA: ATP-binding protein [Myxococcales bacterium]|nr:ATP-binding protein [Myxococcales bacterium]
MRLSVATKIFLGFAVVLCAFGSVSITSIWSLHRLGSDLAIVSECYLPLSSAIANIELLQKNKERDTDRLLSEKDRAAERAFMGYSRLYFPKMMRDRVQAARAVLTRSRKLAHGSDLEFLAEMDRELAALYDRYGDYNDRAAALYDALLKDPAARRGPRFDWEMPLVAAGPEKPAKGQAVPDLAALVDQKAHSLKEVESLIGREVQIVSTRLDSRIANRVGDVHRAESKAAWAIIALTLAAIFVGLLATALSQRTLLPIRSLTEGVKGISRGDFALEVRTGSRDELGILAREFNAMAASLREREKQLLEQRERLLRSERLAAVGRVSAQVTHEIRNPLSSIGLNAELLADEIGEATFKDPAKRREALELLAAMAKEIDRLTEISEQYLAFARPPRQDARRGRVDLGEVAEDLMSFLSPELERAGVTVKLELASGLPAVSGDEGQLRQALRNLVRNAREAMAPRGGQITLRTRAGDGGRQIVVEVADQGPGLTGEALARLFDPFYTTKEQGTGLGLALTQQIAADHGGTLTCQSEAGHGATFALALPAESEPLLRPAESPAATA